MVDCPFGILPGNLQTQLNAHMVHSRQNQSLPTCIPLTTLPNYTHDRQIFPHRWFFPLLLQHQLSILSSLPWKNTGKNAKMNISLNSTGVILLSRSFCWGRQVWRYLDLMSSASRINKSAQYSLKQLLYFEIMSIWFHYISLIWSPSAKEIFQGNANNLQDLCIFLTPFIFPG